MQTIGVIEARNRLGEFLDTVQREPIRIAKKGRPVAVMVSVADYEHFLALEDAAWSVKIQQALDAGFLGVEETKAFLERMEAKHAKP